MQKNVVRFVAPSAQTEHAANHNLPADHLQHQTRQYILDMIGQLAAIAGDHGDAVLAAMLDEVLRRQEWRRSDSDR